jgi:hypothetical protein
LLLFGLLLMGSSWVNAQTEETILLKDKQSYGSGASSSMDHYYPGGIPDIGLFVGNPNQGRRNDRAIFRFDLSGVRGKAANIAKVELVFAIDAYYSQDKELDVEIEHLSSAPDVLGAEVVSDPAADTCGTLAISFDDSAAANSDLPEKRVDVTSAIAGDLSEGRDASMFRLKLPAVEGRPVEGNADGVTIASNEIRRPFLVVTFK